MKLLDDLMGPLDSFYCIYFYIAGLVALAGAVFAALGVIPCYMDKKKQQYCFNLVMLSLQLVIGYLVNRLLFNMCKK
ncbi:MAG: hypothetical protein H8E55_07085 [Pelagibacterales bacterium]|jgi:hypothetical protein|nr:hypothetical protein [Pelagibacterales bacterium]|tara:strand:+ start:3681 stop:3911 length:231 start_codon:yes stop_codon:yes gene_type:complete